MRVVVTGGTGFIGTHLVHALAERGDEPVVLTREGAGPRPALDPRATLFPWAESRRALEGASAIVNLAGESLDRRWTTSVKSRIVGSRVQALENLAAALEGAAARPRVLVSASAVGYYGARAGEPLTEEAPPGTGFLARTCVAWEDAAHALERLVNRVAILRIGMVLGTDGGALPKLLPSFRAGLGSPVGTGNQFVSFIHVADLLSLILLVLDGDARGPINATAPEPVTMNEFARALRAALSRPLFVPAFLGKLGSSMALPLVFGEMATLVLDGQRVLPARAQTLGFTWKFPTATAALGDLVS